MAQKKTAQTRWHRRVLATAGESLTAMTVPLAITGYLVVKGAIVVFNEAVPIALRLISESHELVNTGVQALSRNQL